MHESATAGVAVAGSGVEFAGRSDAFEPCSSHIRSSVEDGSSLTENELGIWREAS